MTDRHAHHGKHRGPSHTWQVVFEKDAEAYGWEIQRCVREEHSCPFPFRYRPEGTHEWVYTSKLTLSDFLEPRKP